MIAVGFCKLVVMTEVLGARVSGFETLDESADKETRADKTKIITAAALGAVGLAASYVEARGLVSGWPPPSHSFRHPWIGYYGAWAASRIRQHRTAAAVTSGIAANSLVETGQDLAGQPDHFAFRWLDVEHNNSQTNLDNLVDLAFCMGGTALFLLQDSSPMNRVRYHASRLRGRLSQTKTPAGLLESAE